MQKIPAWISHGVYSLAGVEDWQSVVVSIQFGDNQKMRSNLLFQGA
jgi:hypothetical protein